MFQQIGKNLRTILPINKLIIRHINDIFLRVIKRTIIKNSEEYFERVKPGKMEEF